MNTVDFLAYEPHFIDHLAPVWHALDPRIRGRFLTDPDLMKRARDLDIPALGIVAPKPRPRQPGAVFDGTPALVASYGDIKKGRRMGYGPFAFLEHGIAQSYAGDRTARSHASYSGGADRGDVELNLVPNDNARARWREAYPDARTVVVGCPKLDTLPSREPGPGPVVAFSFHFPCSVVPETRPAFGTYLEALEEVARQYTVIGHAHPRYFGMDRRYRRLGIEYVPDFTDVCRRADLYVCDNSSTIYEFASTGRPVLVLNAPSYRRNVDHGLRFWEAADVGIQVDRAKDLLPAIAEALEDDAELQQGREIALDIVYGHRSGAAERAAAEIASWLGQRAEVAA
ncbi:MAG TPA: CDP-glycerol glycerophosphotransferase family protein [Candidatus Limnocylindrales bacterium]|nr:CDP-glycerol glycerophosphotransferase family protein [Candidatus Limnocylindrales bacterium]